MKMIDKKIKKYDMLLDTTGRMGRRNQVVKPYDLFAVVDGKDAWFDSWMMIVRLVFSNKYLVI